MLWRRENLLVKYGLALIFGLALPSAIQFVKWVFSNITLTKAIELALIPGWIEFIKGFLTTILG